jgi:hypothetical protein
MLLGQYLLRMSISAGLIPIVFSLTAFPLSMLLMVPFLHALERRSWLRFITFPLALGTFAIQVYFWGLWAAYCARWSTYWFQLSNGRMLYLILGLGFSLAPILWFERKESEHASSGKNMRLGGGLYGIATALSFIAFIFEPSLADKPYNWILQFLY